MRNSIHWPPHARRSRAAVLGGLSPLVAVSLVLSACAATQTAQVSVAPPRVTVAEDPAAQSPPPASEVSAPFGGPMSVRVRLTDERGTRVVTMPLDRYVVGVVRAELPPRALQSDVQYRLLQVQAIVSRTYALANIHRHNGEGFDLCDTTHCQLYRGTLAAESDSDPASRAVKATAGQVITYGGHAIQALFHSSCGGRTTSARAVWGGEDVPYLRPVPDWFCARPTSLTSWEFAADEASLRAALNTDMKTTVGGRLTFIDVVQRDESGRASLVALDGARAPVVRAEELRAVLRRVFGARSFRSNWFTVTRRSRQFVFTGVGYGHGVGLCQTGASGRAEAGQLPTEIISYYYPGTRLQAASLALVRPVLSELLFGH